MGKINVARTTGIVVKVSVLTLFCSDGLFGAQPVVSWDRTQAYLGRSIIACGPVAFAGRRPNLAPNAAAIVIGGDTGTEAVIRDAWRYKVIIVNYHESFPQDIEGYFLGKDVCVIGTVISALVGGAEVKISHPSQLALAEDGLPSMPDTHIRQLPVGAIHWDQATSHLGETKTVCGIAVEILKGRQADRDLSLLTHDYTFEITDEPWVQVHIGDSSVFMASIRHSLLTDLSDVDVYENRPVCATGQLRPSLTGNAGIVVRSLEDLDVLD